ncbi:MAG: DUF5667 domain-containing protein [Bacillota bacterium]|nr:DUF5667 domain-containing protein [Bacillota bacterium]
MFKKILVFVVLFCLVAQGALAASGEGDTKLVTPNQPVRYALKTLGEGVKERLTLNLERKAGLYLDHAGERLKEFEALTQEDFETLKEKLLERHDALVNKAEEIIANKDNLPAYIKAKAVESQVKALELAQERAAKAEDQELAAKWLNKVKAKQEHMIAHIEKNADKMAENMLKRAEATLSNAAEIRTKIGAAENIEALRELRSAHGMKRPMQRLKGALKRFGK